MALNIKTELDKIKSDVENSRLNKFTSFFKRIFSMGFKNLFKRQYFLLNKNPYSRDRPEFVNSTSVDAFRRRDHNAYNKFLLYTRLPALKENITKRCRDVYDKYLENNHVFDSKKDNIYSKKMAIDTLSQKLEKLTTTVTKDGEKYDKFMSDNILSAKRFVDEKLDSFYNGKSTLFNRRGVMKSSALDMYQDAQCLLDKMIENNGLSPNN